MSIETGVHYPLSLNDLPEGWRAAHFGEFTARIEPGFASGEHNQTGSGIPHLRPMNIDRGGHIDLSVVKSVDAAKDKRRLAVGDVLFNNTNSPELVGKTAVISQSGEFAFSNHMTRIQLKESVLPKYAALQFQLLWMRGYFKYNCVKHVNQASISSKTLAHSVPFIWAPLAQQEKIVAELEKQFSRLDEAIANLQRVKANLKRYKASVLKAAVEGRLVETEATLARREGRTYETGEQLLQRVLLARPDQWSARGRYVEPLPAETKDLSLLPDGWTWASIDQLSDFITKGTTPAATKLFDGSGDVQFLKVYNLTFDGSLNHTHKPAYVSCATHKDELARSQVFPGDVLINIVGPPLGQVSVVPVHIEEANINQAIARIRPIKPIGSAFIAIALMCDDIMRWAIRRGKTTAGQANITLELCRALPIPVPPLEEQARIVAEVDRHLSILREVEAEVDANLQRAQALRQSVLSKAFQAPQPNK